MRYATVGRLARGGMGVVDLGTDDEGRRVALKRVPLHGTPEEAAEARRRIRREAEVLRSLDHPGIVRLLDVVDDGDDVVLVLPYLEGGTLAERVRAEGPLAASEVARLARPLLAALAAAHRQGVVHRDVKPSNVLFDGDVPLLADFGVATSRELTQGLTGGGVVGTPAFMAPEQVRGEPVGPAADVFSLGATLRFALTGAGPWEGDGPAAVRRAARGRVAPLARGLADPALQRLLDRMCEADPARRPAAAELAGGPDGTAVRTARRPVLGGVAARRPGRGWLAGRLPPVGRPRAALVAAATVAAVALVGIGAVVVGGGDDPVDAVVATTTAPTAPPCVDLPYLPCGAAAPAPGTDGERCVDGRGDYDGDAVNGCEARPDRLDADSLALDAALEANLVPADDVDEYDVVVPDRAQLLCDGRLRVTLTAPAGVAQRLEVLDGDEELGRAGSTDGTPAEVELVEPRCFDDDRTTLTVRVTSIGGDRSAEPYLLEVDGSY